MSNLRTQKKGPFCLDVTPEAIDLRLGLSSWLWKLEAKLFPPLRLGTPCCQMGPNRACPALLWPRVVVGEGEGPMPNRWEWTLYWAHVRGYFPLPEKNRVQTWRILCVLYRLQLRVSGQAQKMLHLLWSRSRSDRDLESSWSPGGSGG